MEPLASSTPALPDLVASDEAQTPPTRPRIFLSYARGDDSGFVQRVYDGLTAAGFSVWFDRVSMPSRQLTFIQEVRDAIAACDRVVLVVGPAIAVSDYVDQEWRFGLEAGKAISPVLRLNGPDRDGYELIPEELKLLQTEDFRVDQDFAAHLARLIHLLADPVAPLGRLAGVPTLPPHYRAQPERLRALKQELLADVKRPVVVTGAAAKVGVQGMGGIGKSVLAAALARDLEIRRGFPDGVIWVAVRQRPNRVDLQRYAIRALGADATFDDERVGKDTLRSSLEGKAVLLILDDVWTLENAAVFDVMGPRCRLLLTTRDSELVRAMTGTSFEVPLLSDSEALALLAVAARVPVGSLPVVARQVVSECGRLPLALALCGGMAAGGTPWTDLRDALQDHQLEFLSTTYADEPQHASLWRAMEVSVRALTLEQRQRFAQLALFADEASVPEAAVLTLWTHTGELDERAARRLLVTLKDRALLQLDHKVDSDDGAMTFVSLHVLLSDLAFRLTSELGQSIPGLHQEMLAAYQAKCPDGWSTGPADGYFFQHLRTHLVQANRRDELVSLLLDTNWIELKSSTVLTSGNNAPARLHGDIYDLMEDFYSATAEGGSADELGLVRYLFSIVRTKFATWVGAPHRLYAQLYPYLWSAPTSLREQARAWLRRYAARASRSGPWFRQLTVPADAPEEDALAIPTAGPATTLAVSADGLVLMGSVEASLRAWSLTTGRETVSYNLGTAAVMIHFRPGSHDWLVLLSSGRLYVIPENGDPEALPGPQIPLAVADMASEAGLLAVGDQFGQLGVWDLDKGCWLTRSRGARTPINALCFDHSGERLLVARETGVCHLLESRTLRPLLTRPLGAHVSQATTVPFSEGWYLGCLDGVVRLWSGRDAAAQDLPAAGSSPISSLVRSADLLVGGDLAGVIRSWRLPGGGPLFTHSATGGAIRSLALCGKRLAVSGSEGIRVAPMPTNRDAGKPRYPLVCTPPSWSGDCIHAIGGATTGEVVLVPAGEGGPSEMPITALFTGPAAALPSHDLWVGGAGSGIVVVNAKDEVEVADGNASGAVNVVTLDGAGQLVAAGFRGGHGVLWEAQSGGELGRWQMHRDAVTALCFGNDASTLVSAGRDGTIALWRLSAHAASASDSWGVTFAAKGRTLPRLAASEVRRTTFERERNSTAAMALMAGKDMLVVSANDRVAIWSLSRFAVVDELPPADGHLVQVALSPDGNYLAGISVAARCTIWDLNRRTSVCAFQAAPPGLGCCWRQDGRAIAITAAGELVICEIEALSVGEPVIVPWRSGKGKRLRLSCPYHRLQASWRIVAADLGRTMTCPECGRAVRVATDFAKPLLRE